MNLLSKFIGFLTLLVSFFANAALNQGILRDRFHFGEYFAAFTSIKYSGDLNPYAIHGGLDYIPAFLANGIFGSDSYMIGTWFVYVAFSLATAIVLYVLVSKITLELTQLVLIAYLIPIIIDYRDLGIVLLTCSLFFAFRRDVDKMSAIILGIVLPASLYYSANRGVLGLAIFGLIALVEYKKNWWVSALIATFIIVALSYLHPVFELNYIIDNFTHFLKTTKQWSYAPTIKNTLLKILVGLMIILPVAGITYSVKESVRLNLKIIVVILAIFYFQYSTYRSDFYHASFALMFSLTVYTLLVYCISIQCSEKKGLKILSLSLASVYIMLQMYAPKFPEVRYDVAIMSAAYVIYCYIILTSESQNLKKTSSLVLRSTILLSLITATVYQFLNGSYGWIPKVLNKAPNQDVVDAPVINAAMKLVDNSVHCVFDLSNNGVINGLALLPPCTKFSYLVYASHDDQDTIISDLIKSRPKIIIYSSDWPSYKIDGKPMSTRYPKVDNYIMNNYSGDECNLGYCFKTLTD